MRTGRGPWKLINRVRSWVNTGLRGWKHAFDIPEEEDELLDPRQNVALERISSVIVDRGLTTPALFFLETIKPLGFIGSQVMVFFRPFVEAFLSTATYDAFQSVLERRDGVELLIRQLEKTYQEKQRHKKDR